MPPFASSSDPFLSQAPTTPFDAVLSDTFWLLPLAVVAGFVVFLIAALQLTRFVLSHVHHGAGNPFVVLHVLLPKFRREEESTQQVSIDQTRQLIAVAESFFSSLGGLKAQKGWNAWLRGRNDHFSFEIVALNKEIHFYVATPPALREHIEQQLSSVYPDAHIEEIEDYNMFSPKGLIVGGYLHFRRPNAFPIKTYRTLDADPLNSLTNALSHVADGDGAAIQFIVRSAQKDWRSMGLKIARSMQQGVKMEEAVAGKTSTKKKQAWWEGFVHDTQQKEESHEASYRMSPLEEQAVKGVEEKASKAGMDVNIRLLVSSENPVRAQTLLSNLFNAFSQYNIYQFGNAFSKQVPRHKSAVVRRFIHRGFNEHRAIVVNTEEMASLWHLPLPTTETPNIAWLLSRSGPAPVNIPGKQDGIFLGKNVYRGVVTDIHVKRGDRERHMYLVGKTGSGKTEFLASMAIQDIQRGEGIAVIDPHGDLIEKILGHIPPERVDDVIVFKPADMERPVGLNMLDVPEEQLRDFAVQEMVSIFYKLFGAEMIGPMFEHNMRNVMLTLMSDTKNPGTIAEIPRMFSDEAFAKTWVAKLTDPVVRSFWENEMAKTSDFHKSEMLGYLISKVGRFVENDMMRNIIGQTHSSFDFRSIMDDGKIFLVNLSKGLTGEVNAQLLGLIIVTKLQMAALARADMPEEKRRTFYLYIDEFQNFVTNSIATILSEARKYKLCLVMAHQYMSQLVSQEGKTEVRDAVLGNVGNTFVSRIGPEDADILEKIYKPTFSGYDLINSDKFTWYVKMIIDGAQAKPFTMKTVMPPHGDVERAKSLYEMSRLRYGRPRKEVEADILERSALGVTRSVQGAAQESSF